MPLFKRAQVADFFLTTAHPYSKKRSIKMFHLVVALSVFAAIVLVAGAVLENRAQKQRDEALAAQALKRESNVESGQLPQTKSDGYVELQGLSHRQVGSAHAARQLSASQIIKTSDSASGLPIGSQVRVQLLGRVESADSNSPVTAILLEDAVSPAQAVVIPKGAKVIGNGQLDQARERLQVRFHSVVFPEGEQYSLSALAMTNDGASGLTGDFSSGKAQKHASQFLGNFIGGVAEGMKDRQAGGQMGIPFEPGGVKNGLLNGVADSSLGFAKSSSEDFGNVSASIAVPGGQQFILYFEREFHL